MIRFSSFLVVVALGLLVAGGVTSRLMLVYIAIGVSGVALLSLGIGAAVHWRELFGTPRTAASDVAAPALAPVPAQPAQVALAQVAPTRAERQWPEPPAPGRPVREAAAAAVWDSAVPFTGTFPAVLPRSQAPGPGTAEHSPARPPAPPSRSAEPAGSPEPAPAPAPAQPHATDQPHPGAPAEIISARPEPPAAPAPPETPDAPASPAPERAAPAPEPAKSAPNTAPGPAESAPAASVAEIVSPAPGAVADTSGAGPQAQTIVTVVPGVPRYHDAGCILIRFMGEDDLDTIPLAAARDAGCTPCRACLPDQPQRPAE
ncbi:MAG: hypothetical protein M3Z75_04450 [Actinomycetota bacterium]|nr:hypothetical protein [Actinomycetota bacterium]